MGETKNYTLLCYADDSGHTYIGGPIDHKHCDNPERLAIIASKGRKVRKWRIRDNRTGEITYPEQWL